MNVLPLDTVFKSNCFRRSVKRVHPSSPQLTPMSDSSESEFESLKGKRCISSKDIWQTDFHRNACKIATKKRSVSKYSGIWQKVTLWCQHPEDSRNHWTSICLKSLNLSAFENLPTSTSTCSFPFSRQYSRNLSLGEVSCFWQVLWHWTGISSTYLFTVPNFNTYPIHPRARWSFVSSLNLIERVHNVHIKHNANRK